ncbi:TPR domain-containing glycosyltransferase [Desulfosporosinus sp. FKB]|uniref:tetratricopeptide repeat-containing glycosyltransferase family 2 protein n=1 Tax=Desulfosporosinus sp. FKB TaxID=1969835 RepID=UPI000B49EEC2|nr:TPR domain-containing glycosyltransferase [Desulfosporosinus sp. FKB]
MNSRISLAMIVKDEARLLADCLEAVKDEVDEIIIVDTGSTDQTATIARDYTDLVYSFTWKGNFSAARNFALQQATGDWILALDADEVIQGEPGSLRSLINNAGDKEAFLLPLHNPIANSTEEFNTFFVLRLFKHTDRYQYTGKIHEQVSIPDPEKVALAQNPILKHKPLPLRIQHQKRNRNLRSLLQAFQNDPYNPFLHYYLGVEWLMLGKESYALPFLQEAYLRLSDENLLFRAPALKYLIVCLRTSGKSDEALSLCLEASLNYPTFTDLFYLGGLLFEEKEEYLMALKWFKHAIQCGTPQALFSHLAGSDSFLAHYHLGFCYEKLGRTIEAWQAYKAALDSNPRYPYPLYPLFLILLREKGPADCYQYLDIKGYLDNPLLCLTAANLFYLANHVEEAFRCLDDHKDLFPNDERYCLNLNKYCIYSGRFDKGLELSEQISQNSAKFSSAQTLSIIALILLGDFPKAKSLAITLWQTPLTRGEAHILLKAIRLINNETIVPIPPKIHEQETIPLLKEFYKDYLHYQESQGYLKSGNPLANSWGEALETLLKSSEEGSDFLLVTYTHKLETLQQRFSEIFGMGWRADEH